jgi:hypothetical protein
MGTLGTTWTAPAFNDGTWVSSPLAVGYETGTGYESLIGLNVLTAMNGVRTSCYIRIPFNVTNLADVTRADLADAL